MWLRMIVILTLFHEVLLSTNTAVLILARGGSKGIYLKNLSVLGGITLLGRSILTAHKAGFYDVTVSTDHPLIALEAITRNAHIFKRSYATSTDWAPSIWGVLEFLETRPDIDILILLQVTSPFIKASELLLSVKKLDEPKSYDCIFSVTRSHKLRWFYEMSGLSPLNFRLENRPRRQDWAGEFIETGGFYIARTELIKKGYLQNNNCTVWEVSKLESLEVDTAFDLHLAAFLLNYIEI